MSNQKGGVGKTTTAVTLGGLLAAQGQRVVLLDLDPQGSLTSYFRLDPETTERSVYELFRAQSDGAEPVEVRSLLRATGVDRLSLMPASTAMATLDRQLGQRSGMGLVIRRALARLQPHCDYVLMDCPPMLGILMVNALAACERLLIPVQTEFLALKGLERMLRTLEMVGRSRGGVPPCTIVPTFFDRRTRASTEALRNLRDRYGEQLWPRVVPVDTRFREASRAGLPINLHSPGARGSEAYASLLRWLQQASAELPRVAAR